MGLSEVKRQQILDAAISAFQKHGYQACSMDGVADLAQVSKRTIYNHFDNKDELFVAVIDKVIETMVSAGEFEFDPDVPLREQLLEIVRFEIELMQGECSLNFFRMLLGELLHNPKLAEFLQQRRSSCESQFDIWLNNAVSHGVLNIEDQSLAKDQLFGLIKSAAFWPSILDRKPLNKKAQAQVAENTVTMFLRCYQV